MALEYLRLRGHEESRVSSYLSELGVSEAIFDDTVYEAQCDRVIFHLGVVEVIKQECGAFFNYDGVVSPVKRSCCFKSDLVLNL